MTVKEEVRGWLDEHWDPDLTLGEWWQRLADSGWGAPTWPVEWYGKGLSSDALGEVIGAFREVGAPGPPGGLGLMLAGPTIIAHGSDEQKGRWLRPILSGEVAWCQLFSEPGAGSDLASLQCRAVRDGDEWVVTGQKVWTSGAQAADFGMLVARTDPDVPKHAGITWFGIEMDQPGIEVRPLREMTGRALFNEVFFDEARVRDDAIVGDLNGGWAVALTTLANERVGLGGGGGFQAGIGGKKAGWAGRRAGDATSRARAGANAALGGQGVEMVKAAAAAGGGNGDQRVRDDLATLHTLSEISRFTQLRAKSASAAGRRPGPEASTGKLQVSRITRATREAGLHALGAQGMLAGDDAPLGGTVQYVSLFSPAVSIYGGTDEVQKNIIGERVLGLPKEPATDKNVPFRDLKKGTQRPEDT